MNVAGISLKHLFLSFGVCYHFVSYCHPPLSFSPAKHCLIPWFKPGSGAVNRPPHPALHSAFEQLVCILSPERSFVRPSFSLWLKTHLPKPLRLILTVSLLTRAVVSHRAKTGTTWPYSLWFNTFSRQSNHSFIHSLHVSAPTVYGQTLNQMLGYKDILEIYGSHYSLQYPAKVDTFIFLIL